MRDHLIYDEFAKRVTLFGAEYSPPIPTAFPDIHFDAPDSGVWLEVSWIPNRSQNWGIGDEGPTLLQGIGQVLVCAKPGSGIMGRLETASALVDFFQKGTALDVATVYIEPSISGVIQQPDKSYIPVTIYWRSFQAR